MHAQYSTLLPYRHRPRPVTYVFVFFCTFLFFHLQYTKNTAKALIFQFITSIASVVINVYLLFIEAYLNVSDSSCPSGSGAGACVSGQCSPGYSCNSNNVCCAQVVPATVCPDGTQAAGACVNNMCGVGFTCNQGLCCTNSSQTPRCLDGSQAIGACMQGKCGSGYTCTTGNICCPSTLGCKFILIIL